MRELLDDLERFRRQGRKVALARVVDLEGSGPRDPGAAMAVADDGEVVGSVSGGCVEGAVVEAGLEAIATGARAIHTFGYSDDEAFAVGLTCGGTIHLFLEPYEGGPVVDALAAAVRDGVPVALATIVERPGLGAKLLVLARRADRRLPRRRRPRPRRRPGRRGRASPPGTTGVRRYGAHGEARQDEVAVFVESFVPPPRMLIFGAVDFTAALVRVAKVLGYQVTVCDARPVFATEAAVPARRRGRRRLAPPSPRVGGRRAHAPRRRVHPHPRRTSSTCPPSSPRSPPTSATSAPWVAGAHTRTVSLGCGRRASTTPVSLACTRRSVSTSAPARRRRPRSPSAPRCIAVRTGREDVRPLRDTEGPIHAS